MLFFKTDIVSYDSHHPFISGMSVGGKAINLFYLYRNGFNVPRWLIITSTVWRRLSESLAEPIAKTIKAIDFSDQSSIESASKQIHKMILNLNISPSLAKRIKRVIKNKLNMDKRFSVRSSAVGEDSDSNSFAGQMDSFLEIPHIKIPDVIKKVWASAYSSRALTYRHKKGISLKKVSTAVIIQEMVKSTRSGVLFSRNPETREKEINISAGFGLGEGVVQDLVETDTYRMKWSSGEITKEINDKKLRVVPDRDNGGTRIQLLDRSLQHQAVLLDKEILLLAENGKRAEDHFNQPQDIEWAFDSRGEIFILQSRPIIFQTVHRSHYRIWDNSNIVESYPGVTLPLTFSFIQQCYEVAFKKATLGCLIIKKELKRDLHIFDNMIGLLDGRVYYNLLNWYKMLSYFPCFKNHKKSWDQMIGINCKIDFPQSELSLFNKLFSMLITVLRLYAVKHNATSFFKRFNVLYDQYKDIEFSSLSEDNIINLYHSIGQDFGQIWHKTLYNDFCAMKYYDWLKKLCQSWGLDKFPNLHNNLLCGEPNIESVKPIHSLLDLAEIINGNPEYLSLFQDNNCDDIWKNIITDSKYSILKNKLSDYLEKYGDRSFEELKLEIPTYSENPEKLIKLIQNYSKMGLTKASILQREMNIRANAEKVVRESIRNPVKQLLFSFILKKTRRSITNRENMRFARSRLYGIIKRLFRRMAAIFTNKEIINKSQDLYYLTVPEIFNYVKGASVNQELKSIVEIRKTDYKLFKSRNPQGRFCHSGIPYLNICQSIHKDENNTKILKGIGCSSGVSKGVARVVIDPHEFVGDKNYILIAKSTDPGWIFLMIQSKGIVVEKGSVLSHTAIIGRELGIPTIVAADNATTSIKNGETIHIDGSTGVVQCI